MSKLLVVPVQIQRNPYWCWAAVASMISQYYKNPSSQCAVATATLQIPGCDCCVTEPTPNECQTWWDLPRALESVGHYRADDGLGEFATIVQEIELERPLCALMQYRAGPRHYVLLTGYDDVSGHESVFVLDPAGPQGQVPVSEFFSAYDVGKAYWDSWVFTK